MTKRQIRRLQSRLLKGQPSLSVKSDNRKKAVQLGGRLEKEKRALEEAMARYQENARFIMAEHEAVHNDQERKLLNKVCALMLIRFVMADLYLQIEARLSKVKSKRTFCSSP